MKLGIYDIEAAIANGFSLACDERAKYGADARRSRQEAARALRDESTKLADEREELAKTSEPSAPRMRFDLKYGLMPAQVDRAIERGRRAGDVGHRAVAFYLSDCADRGLYQEFGHPSVIPYAMKRHGISRRQARDLITAGRALRELPKVDLAFIKNDLTWSKARAISRVAEPQTEERWLEFAKTHTIEEVEREAALAKKGESPREDRKGLPEVTFNVSLRLDVLLHEQMLLARQKVGAELGHDATDRELAGALLDAFLRRPGECAGAADSLYRVVLDLRPADGSASIRSEDGPMPVRSSVAEAICCDAGVRSEDGQRVPGHAPPISDGLRGRILARDGYRCRCCASRFELHVHHIRWRSQHGSNALGNLMAVCRRCHELVHEGLLVIEGVAPHALGFRDRDGRLLTDPARAVSDDLIPLVVEPVPGGAAAPPVSGFSAGKEGVFTTPIPRQVDSLWIEGRRHLLSWDPKRTVLELEAGQPVDPLPQAAGEGAPRHEDPMRPTTFEDVVGQPRTIASLKTVLETARSEGSRPDPVLLLGPAGLGKTSLARAFAREAGGDLVTIDGAMLDHPLTLIEQLLSARDGDVVFIDEIHAIQKRLGELLYQAVEDGAMDLQFRHGRRTQSVRFVLPKVAFIAATTNAELMPEPLVARFPIREELEPYGLDELVEIIRRAADRQGVSVPMDAAAVLANASGGVARSAIALYRRLRSVLVAKGASVASVDDARAALRDAGVDERGLGPVHRRILETLVRHGRPMAVRRVARAAGVSTEAFRRFYEQALLDLGLIIPTPRGLAALPAGGPGCE